MKYRKIPDIGPLYFPCSLNINTFTEHCTTSNRNKFNHSFITILSNIDELFNEVELW